MSITVHIDLRSSLGSVRDQGARPTCLSLATTVAHEHARASDASLAPEYLHYFASAKGSSDGVLFPDVARALRHPGQPAEEDCPYCPGGLPSDWHPPQGVNLYRRESEPRPPDGNQIAALLGIGRVPVLGISVPQPFYSPTPPWVISSDGPILGRHIGRYLSGPELWFQSKLQSPSFAVSFRMSTSRVARQIVHQSPQHRKKTSTRLRSKNTE